MTFCTARCFLKNKMSYTPMVISDSKGCSITRTLLQQPIWPRCVEALSQLVKRSALADNAAIVLWQRRLNVRLITHRVKRHPIKYEDEVFWHTVRYAAFCRALIRCIAVTKNFVSGRSWPQVNYTPNLRSLLPDATGGGRAYFFGGCEFIRYDDRPRAKKVQSSANIYADRFCRHRTNQSRVVNNVDYELFMPGTR